MQKEAALRFEEALHQDEARQTKSADAIPAD